MYKHIAVIMPVYIKNNPTLELTENAIDSLGEVFLVIVDNGSDTGGEYLKEMADKYIRNDSNQGFAAAMNQGLTYLKNEHPELNLICLSNNDIRVSPNWQEEVKTIMEDKKIYSLHPRMIAYNELFDYGDKIATSGMERWCTGSFFIINTEAHDIIFYDEQYFNSYDDWDLLYRVRETGLYTAYTDRFCYQHHHSFTQKQIPEREANDEKNKELFKILHGEYAEDLFTRMYPDQMKIDYWEAFKIKR